MSEEIEKYVAETGRTTANAQPSLQPSKQSTESSVDYRTVDPHIFLNEAYFGNGGFLGLTTGKDRFGQSRYSYVIAKKTEYFYQTRVANGQYVNEFRGFIESLISPIFSSGVTYDTKDSNFLEFTDKANGQGFSLDKLKSMAGEMAVIHDNSFLIMDAESETGRVKLNYKTPTDVSEGSVKTDGFGELVEIAFLMGADEKGNPIRYKHIKGAVVIEVQKSDKWEIVEMRETGIDTLNVYPMYYNTTPNGEYVSTNPRMIAITYLLANIYNKDVLVDYTALQQGMGLLTIRTGGEISGVADPLSSALVLTVRDGVSNVGAEFATIDPEILQKTSDLVEKKRYALYRLMGKEGVDVVQGSKAPESGVSKAFDFIGRNQALLKGVRMFQGADKWIIETWRKFTSDTVGRDIEIKYPEDFFPMPLLTIDEAEIAYNIFRSAGLDENTKEVLRVISLIVSNGASYEKKRELNQEIEDATLPTSQEMLD